MLHSPKRELFHSFIATQNRLFYELQIGMQIEAWHISLVFFSKEMIFNLSNSLRNANDVADTIRCVGEKRLYNKIDASNTRPCALDCFRARFYTVSSYRREIVHVIAFSRPKEEMVQ